MSESIEFSSAQFPVLLSKMCLFSPTVHFCAIFNTFCFMSILVNYQVVISLLVAEVFSVE